MRALVVTKNDFRQARDGGSKRTLAMVEQLTEAGFEVDAIAVRPYQEILWEAEKRSSPSPTAPLVALLGALQTRSLSCLKWFSWRAASRISELSAKRDYDVLVIEHSQLHYYRFAAGARATCIDLHNLEHELLRNFAESSHGMARLAAKYESRAMALVERKLSSTFDTLLAVSSHDAAWLRNSASRTAKSSVIVATNGVDLDFLDADGDRDDTVVFIAHLGWRPNVDAAEWLVRSAWPLVDRSRVRFLELVGRDPAASVTTLASQSVRLHADVPSVIPFVARARVATAPLLSAGGTRIKILEALAAGTPVVATSLGALGLEDLADEHFIIADTPKDFAVAIEQLASLDIDRSELRSKVAGFTWARSLQPAVDAITRSLHGG